MALNLLATLQTSDAIRAYRSWSNSFFCEGGMAMSLTFNPNRTPSCEFHSESRVKETSVHSLLGNVLIHRTPVGFTVIELLVVISIMSVLMALLSPALKAARDRARQIACLSNLKQLGAASIIYANDHDGYLPAMYSGGWQGSWWNNRLESYLGPVQTGDYTAACYPSPKQNIYCCPSATNARDLTGNFNDGYLPVSWGQPIQGYSINLQLSNGYAYTPIPMGSIAQPSKLFMFCDGCQLQCNQASNVNSTHDFRKTSSPTAAAYRHLNGINVVYCDGHAEWTANIEYWQWGQN